MIITFNKNGGFNESGRFTEKNRRAGWGTLGTALCTAAVLAGAVAVPALAQGDRPQRGPQSPAAEGPYYGGIYDKPFTRRAAHGVTIGGYMDLEYIDFQTPSPRAARHFDQHRFIPFIYSRIGEKISMQSEIEFEHGGIGGPNTGEAIIEFANIDFHLADWFNPRFGIILMPLGKVNALHDAPIQDLTDRPLVAEHVIPTTFSQAGAGAYGVLYPRLMGLDDRLDYEVYLTNGLKGLDGSGAPGGITTVRISRTSGLRGARTDGNEQDNNNSVAVSGRLGYSPFLGTEIGISTMFNGSYVSSAYRKPDGTTGDDLGLRIFAVDGMWRWRWLEILGEWATVSIDRDAAIIADNRVPDRMEAGYIQANAHFMIEPLKEAFPGFVTDESTFTFVVRYETEDLSKGLTGANALDGRIARTTVGLNFRPIEDTVLKFDYQINDDRGDGSSAANRAAEEADGFLFSVATYF